MEGLVIVNGYLILFLGFIFLTSGSMKTRLILLLSILSQHLRRIIKIRSKPIFTPPHSKFHLDIYLDHFCLETFLFNKYFKLGELDSNSKKTSTELFPVAKKTMVNSKARCF